MNYGTNMMRYRPDARFRRLRKADIQAGGGDDVEKRESIEAQTR